ncbi:TPA: hypothetical protein MHT66_02995 [Klebsiella pneumoniae]|nr:hypothetical protein [Klebsiella pneumoniae]
MPGLRYRSLREDAVGRISIAPSGTKAGMAPGMSCPAALRLPGLGYRTLREDPVGRISVAPSGTKAGTVPEVPPRRRCACRAWVYGPTGGSRRPDKRSTIRHKGGYGAGGVLPGGAALAGSGSGIPRSVSRKYTRRSQTGRPVSIANRPSLSASAPHVSRGADTPAC